MLSSMPGGPGNLYPTLLAILFIIGFPILAFVVADRLEQRIVGRLRRENDVEGLVRALKNGWLARKAACALGEMKAGDAVEPLVEMLHDKDDDTRAVAARALGGIGDARAYGPLRQALGDRYRGVRDCASYALKRIQKPDNAL